MRDSYRDGRNAWQRFLAQKIANTYAHTLGLTAYLQKIEAEGAGKSMEAKRARRCLAVVEVRRRLWLAAPGIRKPNP